MANIFALQGLSNAGKSSTLIELMNQIITKYPNGKLQELHSGTKDVQIIIEPVNGMRIGIESQGDPNSRLRKSLADFRSAKCDVVFCACRTRGDTVNWINAMSPPDKIQFIAQVSSQSGQQAANTAKARLLMQMAGI